MIVTVNNWFYEFLATRFKYRIHVRAFYSYLELAQKFRFLSDIFLHLYLWLSHQNASRRKKIRKESLGKKNKQTNKQTITWQQQSIITYLFLKHRRPQSKWHWNHDCQVHLLWKSPYKEYRLCVPRKALRRDGRFHRTGQIWTSKDQCEQIPSNHSANFWNRINRTKTKQDD